MKSEISSAGHIDCRRDRWKKYRAVTAMTAIAIAASGFGHGARAQQVAPSALWAEESAEFDAKVRDTLLRNPEIIRDVLQRLIAAEQASKTQTAKKMLDSQRDFVFGNPNAPMGGNPKGDVTIVEFFDYRCPHCRRVAPVVSGLIEQDKNIRVVYQQYPVLGPESMLAARLALAAQRQGKFEAVHRPLFEATISDETAALALGERLGLERDRLARDFRDPSLLKALIDVQEAGAAIGINGTPAFVIGDRIIPGAADLATFTSLVAAERARGADKLKDHADVGAVRSRDASNVEKGR